MYSNKCCRSIGTFLMLYGLLIYNSFALPIFNKREDVKNVKDDNDDSDKFISKGLAIFYIIIGFLICFLGRMIFKKVIWATGFIAGAYIGYFLCEAISKNINIYLLIGICIIMGIIFALITYYAYKISLGIVGVITGICISHIIYVIWPGLANTINPVYITIVLAIIFLIAIYFAEDAIIMLSTAILGSVVLFCGVDMFIDLGFNDALRTMYHSESLSSITHDGKTNLYLIIPPVVAFAGVSFQYLCRSWDKK